MVDSFDAICKSCQEGKMHKLPSSKGSNLRAEERLELVHIDVCVPICTPLFDKSKYFILFIDNLTRSSGYIFLNEKG